MTKRLASERGTRIYRGAPPNPLPAGSCPHCGRAVAITERGVRRRHRDRNGRDCTGSRLSVVGRQPDYSGLAIPPVQMPPARGCEACGRRPRRKGDGTFAAHRMRADDPSAPYCPGGAARVNH